MSFPAEPARPEPTSKDSDGGPGPTNLDDLAECLLASAVSHSAGRAARTLTPGHDRTLRQTVMALRRDARLDDHTAPGPATLQVLRGHVRLGTVGGTSELREGDWAPIPRSAHDLTARVDSVMVLTVASQA